MKIVILPPLYLPPADYFRIMAEVDMAVINPFVRYDKRFKGTHRTVISSGHGAAFLTVPVSRDKSADSSKSYSWNDVSVSSHGSWWHTHRATLETLYGATPYFHLFKQEFFEFIDSVSVGKSVSEFDIALILAIRRLAKIETPLSVSLDPRYREDSGVDIYDMTRMDFYDNGEKRSAIEQLFREGSL